MLLDLKLDVHVNKAVALLHKFQNILLRPVLLTIYESFVSTHLNYSNMIYDQAVNNYLHQKIKYLKCNADLAIIGVIRGTLTKTFKG